MNNVNEKWNQRKPKGYPPPGHTCSFSVLPLTLPGNGRGQPCLHPSPSVSISLALVCFSKLLYCPLVATWLWVTFTPTLHLIKQTLYRHIQITVTGSQFLCRHRQTAEYTPACFLASKIPLRAITGPDKMGPKVVAEPLFLSTNRKNSTSTAHQKLTISENIFFTELFPV